MRYLESEFFSYKKNQMYCESIAIKELYKKFGTPLYIYSRNFFIKKYNEFNDAFKQLDHRIFYAVKANSNLSVLNTFVKLGSGVDVNSEGELLRVLKTDVDPSKIVFTGVGKNRNEIELCLKTNVNKIKAESLEEVELINQIAKQKNKIARVSLRVNPDVNPDTHPYISTGLTKSKFGIDSKAALRIYRNYNNYRFIKFTGIDMHIGSQINSPAPYVEAIKKLSQIYFTLLSEGIKLNQFNVGGGMGVNYKSNKSLSLKRLADAITPLLKKLNCQIIFEPGRFLTANGGILLTEVLYNKINNKNNFIIVDAAMNDLLRPSMYQAYHHIQPVEKKKNRIESKVDIVGPICETGDFFARQRRIPLTKNGELLAILSAGAYGMVMTSNYNSRRRPAEIIVDGSTCSLVRSRETFDHLIMDEKII